ncbi:Y4oB family protein [Variovorax sp. J22R24]|uniref:Y4oB family protein n=1 Tax=Variovorax gracilis TaxID=3053502 RepID=UPI0025784D71|nr:Y4oB family protein [Variovorax sp. J22R24]MDM0104857.1 Y4oB family protein [Variovorax sp. J22R24]
MAMPQQRMDAFIRAGEILWSIAKTNEHIKEWGAALPESLVDEARTTLCDYPSSQELEWWTADGQGTMHTWMAGEIRGIEQQDSVFARLKVAVGQVVAEMASDGSPFDGDAFVHAWLTTRHPALGYHKPAELLDPEMFVRLILAELSVSREARRVFQSEEKAYRWLRRVNRSLWAIPLEMLGTDDGQRLVMEKLRQIARSESAN